MKHGKATIKSGGHRKRERIPSEFSKRLMRACEDLGITARQASIMIASKTGAKERKIYDYALGCSSPVAADIEAVARSCADALGIPAERLLHDNGITLTIPAIAVPLHAASAPEKAPVTVLPLPAEGNEGASLFLWKIPDGDQSMVGQGYVMRPGTFLVADEKCSINPGNIGVFQPAGFEGPIVRLFKASREVRSAHSFTLVAPNPLFEEISVRKPTTCKVLGRVRYVINHA